MVVVSLLVGMDGVSDDLVAAWLLRTQKLLQRDNGTDDQSDLADDEGLECEEGQSSESDWDQSGSLKFQEEEDWQQGFDDLLLLTTGYN